MRQVSRGAWLLARLRPCRMVLAVAPIRPNRLADWLTQQPRSRAQEVLLRMRERRTSPQLAFLEGIASLFAWVLPRDVEDEESVTAALGCRRSGGLREAWRRIGRAFGRTALALPDAASSNDKRDASRG